MKLFLHRGKAYINKDELFKAVIDNYGARLEDNLIKLSNVLSIR
jgi:hypothetical protein